MFVKGKKTQVGLEIIRYCKANRITVGDFCIKIGVPTHKVDSVLYGRQAKVLPEIAEKFSAFGFDLSKEFIIAPRKTARRIVIYPDKLTSEQLDTIYEIIGRKKIG